MVHAREGTRAVRYLRNAERLGVRANSRRCFEVAEGEFVKFLCDDDLLAPRRVERLVDAFRTTPDITLATSHRQRIDANGHRLPDQPATGPIVDGDSVIAGWTLANAMLMAGLNVVGEPTTALFRKAELMGQAPGYFRLNGTEDHGIIDMVTWTALLLRGDAVYLRDSLSSFRIHPGQRQHDAAKAQRNVESIRELQYAWLALGLFERMPRTEILAQPYPPRAQGSWQRRTVGTLPTVPTFVQAQWTIAPGATARWGV
jgi:glycosyltransferase involved in cell wall biosynthesis